jgi:glycosyltransferase involved in cell wall biosynthesis
MSKQLDLGLFCDRFLHTLYGFHISEFNATLRHFSNSAVYTLARNLWEPYSPEYFKKNLTAYEKEYPDLKGRANQLYLELDDPDPRYSTYAKVSIKHGYCIFGMNAILFLPLWEHLRIPFSFTLYPGGGFQMTPGHCEKGLRQIFASPMFRSVTINMKNTLAYVKETFAVPDDKINYIYGGTVAVDYYQKHALPKKRYPADKETLDICFVANRYTELGVDKGYDKFVEMAHILRKKYDNLRFHVVGNYTPEVLDVKALGDAIKFYGVQPTKWLAGFFSSMDLFFSSSVPHVISRGVFDGFPTTSAVEASVCGVAVASADPLNLNEVFSDGRDMIFIEGSIEAIVAKIASYLLAPEKIYELAEAGQKISLRHFSPDVQLAPRLAHFERLLAKG